MEMHKGCKLHLLIWSFCLIFLQQVAGGNIESGIVNTNQGNLRVKRFSDEAEEVTGLYVKTLFWRLDSDSLRDDVLSIDKFKSMLSKFGLGAMNGHDHDGHDHDGHDHDGHDHDGHDHDGHDHDGHDHDGHNAHDNHNDHDHDGHDHDGHDHDGHDHDGHNAHDNHNDHDHSDHDHHDDHQHRRRRAISNDTESEEVADKCESTDVLLTSFGLDGVDELTIDQFVYLCPALLDRMYTGVCAKNSDHAPLKLTDNRNMGLVWLYMMLCVTGISACAITGILCIPKKSRSIYHYIIQFLMALAAGSMAGDALLHLLPHAMMPPHDHSAHGHGGHDHSGHDHHDHGEGGHDDHDAQHLDALLKGTVALIGLYAFFYMERCFAVLMARAKGHKCIANGDTETRAHMLHSHSHADPHCDEINFVGNSTSNHTTFTEVSPDENGKAHHWPHPGDDEMNHGDAENGESSGHCPTLTPLALVIIVGDMVHNTLDGLAIGAAFSVNTTVGLSTSLAVFCHELPHEIGDFAVLIKSGLTKKQAVILNFLSALSCYVGAIAGILVQSTGTTPMWIFAGVAGMFLYIALVDLVPEMTHIYMVPGVAWGKYLALHSAGLFFGSLFMFIIGFYEHKIQAAFG